MRTIGLSNKLTKTLLGAVGAPAIALLVHWIASGEFDRVEFAGIVGLGLTAAVGFTVGYGADPDTVEFSDDNVPGGGYGSGESGYGLVEMAFALCLLLIGIGVLVYLLD